MPRVTFTDLGLRSLKAKEGQRLDVWDAKQPGFGVRVSPNGTKTFVLMYWLNGRKHRMTLGHFPSKSLSDARADALAAQSKIEKGESPLAPAPTIAPNDALFPTVVDRFVEKYCAVHNRTSTAYETERILRMRFASAWRDRDVRSITRADVIAVLDKIIADKAPSAANHALAAVRKLFSWCVERSIVETNPCFGIRRPAPVSERDRALDDDELAKVWSASLEHGGAFGTVVQLLILTAQRRGEVAGMRWSEIDLEKRTWTIPADRTKNKRVHVLPLTPHVHALVDALPRTKETGSLFVFPARGNPNEPMSGFSKLSPKIAATIDVENWTLHDLRRTAATGMARLGAAPHVVERVLNHASGTFAGVAGIYNRFNYMDEMRATLGNWESCVLAMVAGGVVKGG
jgi:integrase